MRFNDIKWVWMILTIRRKPTHHWPHYLNNQKLLSYRYICSRIWCCFKNIFDEVGDEPIWCVDSYFQLNLIIYHNRISIADRTCRLLMWPVKLPIGISHWSHSLILVWFWNFVMWICNLYSFWKYLFHKWHLAPLSSVLKIV